MPYSEIWETYPSVGKDILPDILDLVREPDGQVYALPLTGFYEGLYVNQEIFDKYDLDLPTDWAKFEVAVKVLRDNGITPIAGPLAQSHYLFEHFVFASAGKEEYEDTLEGEIPQSWLKGLDNLKHFNELGAFPEDALSLEIESSQHMFTQEKAAMILEGSWFIGRCNEALQDKMVILPMPVPEDGAKGDSDIIAGFSAGYYISRKAYDDQLKQEVVVDLVSHLTSGEAIKAIAAANGGIPSADVQVDGLSRLAINGQRMFLQADVKALPIDSRLRPEAFNHIINDGIPYIVYGNKTSEEVLLEAKEINDR